MNSDFVIMNENEDSDPCYGLEKFFISDNDVAALLNGKKLYGLINDGEYAFEIYYRKEGIT